MAENDELIKYKEELCEEVKNKNGEIVKLKVLFKYWILKIFQILKILLLFIINQTVNNR